MRQSDADSGAWPTELFVLSAADRGALATAVADLRSTLTSSYPPALAELAAEAAAASLVPARYRLALVATGLEDLQAQLDEASKRLAEDGPMQTAGRRRLFFGTGEAEPPPTRVAWLFPGQGAQYPHMLADHCLRFPSVQGWFDNLDELFAADGLPLPSHSIAPPDDLDGEELERTRARLYGLEGGAQATVVASLALAELLERLAVPCDVMVGHSNGENSALIASGTIRFADRGALFQSIRQVTLGDRKAEAADEIPKAVLLAVSTAEESLLKETIALAEEEGLCLALDNCPHQVVLVGADAERVASLRRRAPTGSVCLELPFDRPYHTPLFERNANAVAKAYEDLDIGPGHTPVFSCVSAGPFPRDAAEIRTLATRQWSSCVRFRDTVEALYGDGVRAFIELGPGDGLTGFVGDILKGRPHLAVACDRRRGAGLDSLQQLLARLFVAGHPLDLTFLFACRGIAASRPQTVLPAYTPAVTAAAIFDDHCRLMDAFLAAQSRVTDSVLTRLRSRGTLPRGEMMKRRAAQNGDFDPAHPLLGRVVARTPGRLVARRRLDLASDLFLRDHTLGRLPSPRQPDLLALPVVPLTFSMEMLAEAAVALVGDGARVVELSDVRSYRWLAVDRGILDVQLTAHESQPTGAPEAAAATGGTVSRIEVKLSTCGSTREEFVEGTVLLAKDPPAGRDPLPDPLPALSTTSPASWSAADFYRYCLFHGPRLQGIRSLRHWNPRGLEAEVRVLPQSSLFRHGSARLEIPSGLLDCSGQLAAWWLVETGHRHFGAFPSRVEALTLYRPRLDPGYRLTCRARITATDDLTYRADFDFLDERGLVARLAGFQLRYFDLSSALLHGLYWPRHLPPYLTQPLPAGEGAFGRQLRPVPRGLLDEAESIWTRALAHVTLNARERDLWHERANGQVPWLLERLVAKDALRQWATERYRIDLAAVDLDLQRIGADRLRGRCRELESRAQLPEIVLGVGSGGPTAVLDEVRVSSGRPSDRSARIR